MLAALLCKILVQDPQKRVNLGQVLEHDFFKFAGCPPDLEEQYRWGMQRWNVGFITFHWQGFCQLFEKERYEQLVDCADLE